MCFSNRIYRIVSIVIVTLFFMVVPVFAQTKGTVTDSRDGKKYRTVKIGDRIWMAENLNYQPKDGNSWCYKNDETNCTKYGRLYDWETATKVCPHGWRLGNDDDWKALVAIAGGGEIAGTKLRAKNGWKESERLIAGTDDVGFSALPGGVRSPDEMGNSFLQIGIGARWWSTPDASRNIAYEWVTYYDSDDVRRITSDKSAGNSVRCVRN